MSLFRRGNKVKVLKIIPGTSNLELKSMVLRDNMLHDRLEDSKYTVSARPVQLEERGQKTDLYAVDQERGCVVDLDIFRDENSYITEVETPSGRIQMSIKTNPALMCDITGQFFRRPPDQARSRQLLAIFFGLLFGFFFGLMFWWFWWQMRGRKTETRKQQVSDNSMCLKIYCTGPDKSTDAMYDLSAANNSNVSLWSCRSVYSYSWCPLFHEQGCLSLCIQGQAGKAGGS